MMRALVCRYGLAAALAAASVVVVGEPASAHPASAGGAFVVLSDTQTVVGQAAGNLVIAEVITLDYVTGPLQGSATDSDTFVVHADGSFEGRGLEVCNGCVVGSSAPGDFLAGFTFRGAGDNYSGHLEVMSAAGGLSGLHGGGAFAGVISTNVNSYDYHFELRGK